LPLDIAFSVCPHDCPSACALEVELFDGWRIGRVRGAQAQAYTHGVVCAKVARYAERLGASHPGFKMSVLEIIDRTLLASGSPRIDDFPTEGWLDCCPAFDTAHFLDGFAHPDKKFHFRANWRAMGPDHRRLPAFPDHVAVIDDSDPAQPFRLIAAPSRSFLTTSFNNTPSSLAREGRPTALVHPETLARLKLAEGDRIRIGNRRGSVVVHARAFAGLQRRVVIVEGLWPNYAFEEGIGINLLISADPGWPRGGAVFHDTSVWLSPM
jgi:anaerobic selenocysteine-containing dehydrogenase